MEPSDSDKMKRNQNTIDSNAFRSACSPEDNRNKVDTGLFNLPHYDLQPASNPDPDPQPSESQPIVFSSPKDSFMYSMENRRRGKCVVFHHQNFDPDNGTYRKGSENDIRAIERTFKEKLRFDVVVYDDLEFNDIRNKIDELCEEDHSDANCICIIILSHGTHGNKIHSKDVIYPFQRIWKKFSECPTLIGKPKIFFLQACRGDCYGKGTKGKDCTTDSDGDLYTIPRLPDFLFGYSTMNEHVAVRNETDGTWYIQTLCNMIDQYWQNTDLQRMLTMVACKVALEFTYNDKKEKLFNIKQVPNQTSTLTRDVYFIPTQTLGSFIRHKKA